MLLDRTVTLNPPIFESEDVIMQRFGSRELVENVIRQNLCIGCGACNNLCPYFKSYNGKTTMLFPCTLPEGRCFAYCPKTEVDLDELSAALFHKPYGDDPLGYYRSIMMSRAGARAGHGLFQAGGTVSALMQFALEKRHIDGAILTNRKGIEPTPILATESKDILKCASSKYTAAPTLAALNRAIKEGFGNLGIVSTPCQTLAVAQMRLNPLQENTFRDPTGLVIGIFCTWALDFQAFKVFLSQRIDLAEIRKIDIPPPPAEVMEVFTDCATIEYPLSEIRQLVPEACSYCIDMTAEFSDISVGVMEGRTDMNTLITRTDRGQRIVDEAASAGYLVLSDLPDENLEHLKWAADNKKKRAFAKAEEKAIVNTPAGTGPSYLRINHATLKKIRGE